MPLETKPTEASSSLKVISAAKQKPTTTSQTSSLKFAATTSSNDSPLRQSASKATALVSPPLSRTHKLSATASASSSRTQPAHSKVTSTAARSAPGQDTTRKAKGPACSMGSATTSNGVAAPPTADSSRQHSHQHADESTSTDDLSALTSRIGFEPRSIFGLPDPSQRTNQAIVWLDIDNTLYKRSTRIADLMAERIRAYFHGMGLSDEEAKTLHLTYYKTYGLAIRGLVKHHQIDPLDYDLKCDASLPLEDILRPDQHIKRLLSDIDRTRVRVFAATNAYKYHADRVLRLLDLDDQVEGIVYCDYSVPDFACKPELDYYRAAMAVVGATPNTRHYFVDDSSLNIVAAKEIGWHSCVYFREEDDPVPSTTSAASQEDKQAAAAFDLTALVPRPGGCKSSLAASSVTDGFDEEAIRREFQKLPAHMRITLLGIILDACLPGDIAAMTKTLEKHLRSTRDMVSGLPDSVALRIFEKLPIQDLLRCRYVSKKWQSLAATPEIWRSHALALTESDPVKLTPPSDSHGWEPLVKGLFFRERNWAKGLAQSIHTLEGHSGFVTSMKLKGRKTLVSGSHDETIRVWDLSTGLCRKVLRAKAIACLDFLLDEGVLCAGLYDTGRVLVWDMKSWELIQTLSGHNRGIRNVAINQHYLVSVGQDKAIVVWDWKTGAKIVRFGQQSNVSLGVSLVDTDKIVAVTVDGMIRCFSIPRREMIGQYQLTKLGGYELGLGARLGDLASSNSMLEWFAAHGNTMTVASKNVVVHLEWREHVEPVTESHVSLTAEGLRRSASSHLSNAGAIASPLRQRRDSTMSSASTAAAPQAYARDRHDSNASTTSSTSGIANARSPRHSNVGGSTPSTTRARTGRASLGGMSSSQSPGLSTPSRPRPSTSTRRVAGPAPWPLANTELEPGQKSGPSTPQNMSTSSSTASLSFPSTVASDVDEASLDASATELNGSIMDAEDCRSQTPPGATRIAPDLSTAPRVVSILDTPDVSVGCVDPKKRRIVASTRFSSRAGAERRIYTSSLPFDHGKTSTQLEQANVTITSNPHSNEDQAATSSTEGAAASRPKGNADESGSDGVAHLTVPIRGAWEARSSDLATPARNPMVMELDHESVVVGCADGVIYRIYFVGSEYGPETLVDTQAAKANGSEAAPGVGDATITDLLQLREVWKEIMIPENDADHPGRLRRDRVKEMGLK